MLNPMEDVKQHEYALLDEIAQDSLVTQGILSRRLGIAVGSVNWYIKRLIHRGWIKVSHLDRTRLQYDLTPEGMRVFSKRALLYMRDSLKVYVSLREKAKSTISELKQRGITEVYLQGNDEVMDIIRLTCIENGIVILDSPKDVILKYTGQGYKVVER
ncbi:MAG TPA: winged helix-turn-helix transcriptional regulator [Anaerolineales bacterium]|nr:winged helix-turn-helix transcriptional regulator [Anaerolineales bacterium]